MSLNVTGFGIFFFCSASSLKYNKLNVQDSFYKDQSGNIRKILKIFSKLDFFFQSKKNYKNTKRMNKK